MFVFEAVYRSGTNSVEVSVEVEIVPEMEGVVEEFEPAG